MGFSHWEDSDNKQIEPVICGDSAIEKNKARKSVKEMRAGDELPEVHEPCRNLGEECSGHRGPCKSPEQVHADVSKKARTLVGCGWYGVSKRQSGKRGK